MRNRTIPGILGGALILLASAFGGTQARSVEKPDDDVVILNDHLHVHKVFVFDAEGKAHVLGFIGHDQVKGFDVPEKIEAMGPYRIAVQQYLPLPQLGVPVDEHPYKMTQVLDLQPDQTVSIMVGTETHLSSVEIVTNR